MKFLTRRFAHAPEGTAALDDATSVFVRACDRLFGIAQSRCAPRREGTPEPSRRGGTSHRRGPAGPHAIDRRRGD